MSFIKNELSDKMKKIKENIDESPDKMRYVRENLQYMIEYIKKLKKQNPDYSINSLTKLLYGKMKKEISSMSKPTRSDMYLYKTSEYLLKNPYLMSNEIEIGNRNKYNDDKKKTYIYTSNMDKNIKTITKEILTIMLNRSSPELKQKFINNTLDDEENRKVKEKAKKVLETFHNIYAKEIKKEYSIKLSKIVRLLDEMGHLRKYNDRNNRKLDELQLPVLKYEYEAKENKFGLTDLKNPEFLNRFSLEEIIAMTSFYGNRLAKEVVDYNESLYIVHKIGVLEEIFKKEECELKVTDEELREIIAQLRFLSEIANKIVQESAYKSNKNQSKNKVTLSLEDNQEIKIAIKTYEKLYNELYENFFLTQFYNNFEIDLDIATIIEIDRYNLYLAKDFDIESLMVTLTDKGKNKNMNWGYIPENKNGKNSIENKEKFVLIGIDMKGYNMPIKLHFERKKLETFLTNYVKDTKVPFYEGNEDMEIPCKGYMTTQVYMPLTKEQRKDLKGIELPVLDDRYHFLEHIKWMMLPNRYPNYLCDDKGNKKNKKHVDVKSGETICKTENIIRA